MVDPDFLDKLDNVARLVRACTSPFGGIQLIICGDFMQLPPVSRSNNVRFAFDSRIWSQLFPAGGGGASGAAMMRLSHVYRQRDDRLVRVLQQIRTGTLGPDGCALLRATAGNKMRDAPMYACACVRVFNVCRLFARREDVDEANCMSLARIPGEARVYPAKDSGAMKKKLNESFLAQERLVLKIGGECALDDVFADIAAQRGSCTSRTTNHGRGL